MYTKTTFPSSTDAGTKWLYDNFIVNDKAPTISNIINAAEDQNAVRLIFTNGSTGKLTVGPLEMCNQVVAAWKLWSGTTGAGNPSDPLSTSVNNLTTTAISDAVNSSAGNTIVQKMNDVAVKTGMPSWAIWIGVIAGLFMLGKFIINRFKKRRR